MYLKFLHKPWLVQNKPSAPICREENKGEFLERQFQSEKLWFVNRKETEHSFELFLSICVFYRHIFNLKRQNFSLDECAPAIVDGWHLLTCQICLFPHSLCVWPYVFCWGGGYGQFSLGKNFFLIKSLFFSLTYSSVRIFFSIIYVVSDIFLSAGYYFSQLYPCKPFLLEISL